LFHYGENLFQKSYKKAVLFDAVLQDGGTAAHYTNACLLRQHAQKSLIQDTAMRFLNEACEISLCLYGYSYKE
jgi:hypothetical protein